MLINFSVRNFGPIKEKQTLSFEADKSDYLEDYYVIKAGKLRLLKLGLIYGANASGKTTVLKALSFLRRLVMQPFVKKDDPFKFTPYLFDPQIPNQSTEFSIEFLQNGRRFLYEVALTREYISQEALYVYPQKVYVFRRTTDVKKQLTEVKFNDKFQIPTDSIVALRANTLWNNTLLGGFLKTNIEQEELRAATDWFNGYLISPIFPRTDLSDPVTQMIQMGIVDKNAVLNILQRADLGISDIAIREREREREQEPAIAYVDVKLEHTIGNGKYKLPFNEESLGSQRYYGLAGMLYQLVKKSGLVSIDELESSLHPDLLLHFLRMFLINSKQSQLLATTHYRELLNNRDLFRNDAIWITDKTENNATELYSLADFDTSVIRDTSNILNAYKSGKLGGVPDLGDDYIDLNDAE